MNTTLAKILLPLLFLGSSAWMTLPRDETVERADETREPGGTSATVALAASLSHPYVRSGAPEDIYLCVTLRGPELTEVRRLGMNLALVVDRSGSMASEDKLRFAMAAAEQLVDRLRPEDRLAIVAYDDEIRTLVPSTPARERDTFLDAIRSLYSGSSTNLYGGMVAGYEEVLKHFDEEDLNRVILISDGLANVGVTDPEKIWRRAKQCRKHGVRVSTMGVGVEYDEVLMSRIAEHSGGNYYYIDHPETMGSHLDAELRELGKVVARNLIVTIQLGEGVEVVDVFGYEHESRARTVTIPVRDMFSGQRRKIVLKLRVPHEERPELRVASVSLRYDDVMTRAPRATKAPVLATRYTSNSELIDKEMSAEVMSKVEIVLNALALQTAMQHQKEGRVDLARELLTNRLASSQQLNDTVYRSEEVLRQLTRMNTVVQQLDQTKTDPLGRRDLQLRTQLQVLGYLGGN